MRMTCRGRTSSLETVLRQIFPSLIDCRVPSILPDNEYFCLIHHRKVGFCLCLWGDDRAPARPTNWNDCHWVFLCLAGLLDQALSNRSFSFVNWPNSIRAYRTMLQQIWLLLILILFAGILQSFAFWIDAEGQMELTARSKKYRFFCKRIPATLFGHVSAIPRSGLFASCHILSQESRYEAISWFLDKGLTIPEAASVSGHKTALMLMRYAHPDPVKVRQKMMQ